MKGHCTSEHYMLEVNEYLIKDGKKISKVFNDSFINMIGRSTDKKPATSSKDKSLREMIDPTKTAPA